MSAVWRCTAQVVSDAEVRLGYLSFCPPGEGVEARCRREEMLLVAFCEYDDALAALESLCAAARARLAGYAAPAHVSERES